MFTGIIQKTSKVKKTDNQKGSFFVEISKPGNWKLKAGDSIAVNGICSTIKKVKSPNFLVEYMPETIKKTTVKKLKKGTLVNLEKSLKLNDLLDGHLVQGHIDSVGKIVGIKKEKQSKVIKITVPAKLMKLIAPKGSIAVDGISLTVVTVGKNWFTVSLVSYTLENTNLGGAFVGQLVNIETDVMAKYVYNIINH